VVERELQNSRAGRFDNLPLLGSVYKDPAHALTAEMVGRMQYGANDHAETPLQAQYGTVLEPDVTPLSLGALPQVKRGTGLQYQNPLTPEQFKPNRREVRTEELWQPSGTPHVKGRMPIVHQQAQQRIEQLETKIAGGHGALDGFQLIEPVVQPGPHISMGNPDALVGFAKGEYMTPRTGGLHPRTRIFRVPETTRGRLDAQITVQNPTHAVGNPGSLYQAQTGPLGETRVPYNSFVTDYHRPPQANDGLGSGPLGRGIVDMGVTQRACTEGPWNGPMGSDARDRHSRRIVNMYVKPKMATNPHGESGPADAPRGVTRGAYEVMDAALDLQEQVPQRMCYMDNTTQMPAPHAGGYGNNAAYSYFDEQRHTAQQRDTEGRALPGGRDFDMVAGGAERFYQPNLRDAHNKQTGLAGDTPYVNRSTAQQVPEEFTTFSRRLTPQILVEPDCALTSAYRCNPYVPPLPSCH
jgi:hypothetical protein